jgi:peptide/nickel transport system ATP-binding protein/oligopeptide transport system ATP-binding protein
LNDEKVLVKVESLKVYYPVRKSLYDVIKKIPQKHVKAVDGISFTIRKSETLALVGESGCGKTTVGNTLIGIQKPTEGRVLFDGIDISGLPFEKMRRLRKHMQFVFQDPYSSLNPRMTIRQMLRRSMTIHNICSKADMGKWEVELIRMTGIAEEYLDRYPHEFSGGQRQRISIARALAVNPGLIIADEPTAALDVSVQAQILNLLLKLKKELALTMMFISHDLSVVNYISDRTAVMYLGHIVETGPSGEVFKTPVHPYSMALLEALPRKKHGKGERKMRLSGSIPSPASPPSGCSLHPRCPLAFDRCAVEIPELVPVGNNRMVACHKYPNRLNLMEYN